MPEPIEVQPMIAVTDVERSSAWWQRVLGAESGHGGGHYEQLRIGERMVMQLHLLGEGHHHGRIGEPGVPLGNGVVLWFHVEHFDEAVERVRGLNPLIVADVHVNPNAGHREIWFRDPDNYLIVFAGP